MGVVSARVRRGALVVTVALLTAGSVASRPSHAVELPQVAGWWIAIDDALPRLWKLGAIVPMEEILQIDANGNVADRILNLRAATPKACADGRACGDLPALAAARLQVSGNSFAFTDVAVSNARLDSVAGTLLIRQEAVTTTPEWTVTIEGERMTLRATATGKVRNLVRVDPDRLRGVYAGMLASNWPAEESWRCFLGNAMSNEPAFAPLRASRSYRRPGFVDRYLKFASYIVAIRSALAFDGASEELRRQRAVGPDKSMVEPLDKIGQPLSADDRQRLSAVLTYIDQHRRTMVAFNAASAKAAATKSQASANGWEAANREAAAKGTTEMANAAESKSASAAADHERIQAASAFQTQAAREAYAAAKEAMAAVALKESAGAVAAAGSEAARRAGQSSAPEGGRRPEFRRRSAAASRGCHSRRG